MRRIGSRILLTPSLTLATLLAVGLGALWFILCFTTGISLFGLGHGSTFRHLVFTADGQAILQSNLGGHGPNTVRIYHTLDGKLVADPDRLPINHSFSRPLPPAVDSARGIPSSSWRNRLVGFSGKTPSSRVFWYLVHDGQFDGAAYFVGYDPLRRARVGFLARDGYHDTLPARSEWFQIPLPLITAGGWAPWHGAYGVRPNTTPSGVEKLLIYSGGELSRVDFFEQAVEKVTTPDRVIALVMFSFPREKDSDQLAIAVRLPEEVLILSDQGELEARLPLPKELRDKSLTLRGTLQGEVILQADDPTDHFAPTTVVWMSAEGKPLRTETVKLRERDQQDPLQAWMLFALLPFPLLMAVMGVVTSVPSWNNGISADFAVNFAERVQAFWLPMTVLMVLSAMLALLAYRRQRRYESRAAVAWAVFVLLLGPLGLVAYLLHRPWPVRTACEHCGRPMPRNRSQCLGCEQTFPAPELRGIEVFA